MGESRQEPVVIGARLTGQPPVSVGGGQPLALICGPCVIESRESSLFHAAEIAKIARRSGVPLIFKSSYDKANRTSLSGFRGLGLDEGLKVLGEVRSEIGVPVVTDVHSEEEAIAAAGVVDLLQIPAFLCRQTNLLLAAGSTGCPVMIKKGQFLHPADMAYAVDKVFSTGNENVLLCERGTCFGYRELVVDFRSLAVMRALGQPVVFDATHSVQIMGGALGASGGNREFVPLLARAAVAAGVDAVFLECHEQPEKALSDGPNMVPLADLEKLLGVLKALDEKSREMQGAVEHS